MKCFWQSKDGKFPPRDASFFCHPFEKGESFHFPPSSRIETLPSLTKPVRILKRDVLPEKKEWISSIEKALKKIEEKKIEKVVLARRSSFTCESAPDPLSIAAALFPRAENATLFCFVRGDSAWIGATPEHLFIRKGSLIQTEAVAGTRKRGKDANEDRRLEQELLCSLKDQNEFSFVRHFLAEKLSPFCSAPLKISSVQVRKTNNVQHLQSTISGQLKPGIEDPFLLKTLHPTPALCGMPQQQALDTIHDLEPFERGFYGGVVGWSSKEEAEYAVLIRSCFIEGKTVHLYAGTGIVEGSDPEEEWRELDWKIGLYKDIFQ